MICKNFSNFGSQRFLPTAKEVEGIDAKHKGGGSRLDKTEKKKFFEKVAVKNRIFIPNGTTQNQRAVPNAQSAGIF